MIYTEAVHAANLIKMLALEAKDGREMETMCPSAFNMDAYNEPGENDEEGECCNMCVRFVEMHEDDCRCPCIAFGETGAIKRTKNALKEKGYI